MISKVLTDDDLMVQPTCTSVVSKLIEGVPVESTSQLAKEVIDTFKYSIEGSLLADGYT